MWYIDHRSTCDYWLDSRILFVASCNCSNCSSARKQLNFSYCRSYHLLLPIVVRFLFSGLIKSSNRYHHHHKHRNSSTREEIWTSALIDQSSTVGWRWETKPQDIRMRSTRFWHAYMVTQNQGFSGLSWILKGYEPREALTIVTYLFVTVQMEKSSI